MSSSETAESPGALKIGDVPYETEKADVLLISLDRVGYKTFKALLSFASPFFSGMFGLPQPPKTSDSQKVAETYCDLPVVHVSENSDVLGKLLAFCHPFCSPTLDDLNEIQVILSVSLKYDMQGVVGRVRQSLALWAEPEPLRVYAISCIHKLENEARIAAKYALNSPMFPRKYVPELEFMSAGALHRFEQYHHQCGKTAKALSVVLTWINLSSLVHFGSECYACSIRGKEANVTGGKLPVRFWWKSYMENAAVALEERPRGDSVTSQDIMNNVYKEASKCSSCREKVFIEMKEFSELFAKEVELAISTVQLKVLF